MTNPYGMELDWRDNIKVGDVLRTHNGNFRIVRKVYRRHGDKFLGSVTFTIQQCSWTGRCYTIVNRSDLKQRKFSPTGVRVTKMTTMDKRINRDIIEDRPRGTRLSCCDVRGIP